MISAAIEMQNRFPLTDAFFNTLIFLNPAIALSINKPPEVISLQAVWNKFNLISGIDGSDIDREWKNIAINFSDDAERRKGHLVKIKCRRICIIFVNFVFDR